MSFKNVLIFGDSYSTFKGYVPDGYAIYYSENERPETDVRHVEETWWHALISETDSKLILNNSWSGSTVCYMGYNNTDCSETSSFIYRFKKLKESGFFEKNTIDTVFVFGGTNDNWAGDEIGELKFSDFKKDELYSVLPAFCCLMDMLKSTLLQARIIFIINTELKPEIVEGIKTACKHFELEYIELQNINKNCGHPTVKGMQEIKEQIIKSI